MRKQNEENAREIEHLLSEIRILRNENSDLQEKLEKLEKVRFA